MRTFAFMARARSAHRRRKSTITASKWRLPAGTQKVITALAALLQLGPDFRFTTTLETKGSLDGGVLKGDLIARFGGDPDA
ncbi:D-alanyl-D-alanine carboxypeptidase [Klebsiella pneumoniae]|nr:D-alanyl-D-alanine carboxypeptidase [Klebsiella pneumoniae]